MLRGQYLKDRNAYIASEEPGIFHCHHYNTYLQAVIEDTSGYLDVHSILVESSQEIAYGQLSSFFKTASVSVKERTEVAEDFFRFCGFGKLNLSNVDETGGLVDVASDHYGVGWISKFGKRDSSLKGVSFFSLGYILGAIEAIYNLDMGSLSGQQVSCIAKGDPTSSFEITKLKNNHLVSSPKEGAFQASALIQPENTKVDYLAIREALINMPIEGSADEGLIRAFGVILTRMYANYYCLISYKFLHLLEEKMGDDGVTLATDLLTECGHVCAFNTFGGIMQSAEWNGLIKPMLQSKEDWVHGIVAVVNAFGWGIWEVEELDAGNKLVVKITSGYESNSYIKKYEKASIPISFLAKGGVAGIMNLVYHSLICDEPVSLDEATYSKLFKGQQGFSAVQVKCRAKGDEYDLFEATLKK